jgi:hypothetical protein
VPWEPEEIAAASEALKRAGKVRHFGVRNQNRLPPATTPRQRTAALPPGDRLGGGVAVTSGEARRSSHEIARAAWGET